MEGFKQYQGKKVFISLKNHRVYTGVVKEILDQGNGLVFISIIDKFGNNVTFATGELISIQEEKE